MGSKQTTIPIGVLVHNNPTINKTIDSILLQQTGRYSKRIIVGANGCNDETSHVVRAMMRKHPEIDFLCTEEKGKPVSWNQVMSSIRKSFGHGIAIFADSDVLFKEPTAILTLFKCLQADKSCLAASATIVPEQRTSYRSIWERLAERFVLSSEKLKARQNTIHGRCYAIRTDISFLREMPKDVVDDSYLTSIIRKFAGEGAIKVSEARAYFRTEGSFLDIFQRMKRINMLNNRFKEKYGFPLEFYTTYRWNLGLLKNIQLGDVPFLLLGVPFLMMKSYYAHCHQKVSDALWKPVTSARL